MSIIDLSKEIEKEYGRNEWFVLTNYAWQIKQLRNFEKRPGISLTRYQILRVEQVPLQSDRGSERLQIDPAALTPAFQKYWKREDLSIESKS